MESKYYKLMEQRRNVVMTISERSAAYAIAVTEYRRARKHFERYCKQHYLTSAYVILAV